MQRDNSPAGASPAFVRADRRPLVLLVFLALLAAALRLWGIGNWSLWLDEAMQVDYAGRPLSGIVRASLEDGAHPPLSCLVTAISLRVSSSDLSLRLPSVLFGVGTVLALFFGAGGWSRPRRAFAAAGLFAVLPAAVHYGQEIRPYSLALFLVALAQLARRRFAESGDRRAFVGHVLFGTGAVYTLYFAVFPVAAGFLFDLVAALRRRHERAGGVRWALAAPAAVFVLYLPWVVALSHQPRRAPEMPAPRVTAGRVAELAVGLAADRNESLARLAPAAFVWALALLGIAAARGRRTDLLTQLAATFALPLLFLQGIDHWWSLRYVLLALLPLSESFGEGVGSLASRAGPAGGALVAAVLALTAAVEVPALAGNARSSRPDWRRPAAYLEAEYARGRGGDVIAADPWSYLSLRFQTGRLARPIGIPRIAANGADLHDLMAAFGTGWVVRTPHHPVPKDVDELLATSVPWRAFPQAEEARLYRFEGGRLVPPTSGPPPRSP